MADKKKRRVSMRPKPAPKPEIAMDPAEPGSDKSVTTEGPITGEGRRVFMGSGTVSIGGMGIGNAPELTIDLNADTSAIMDALQSSRRMLSSHRSGTVTGRTVYRTPELPELPTSQSVPIDEITAHVEDYLSSLAFCVTECSVTNETEEAARADGRVQRLVIGRSISITAEYTSLSRARNSFPNVALGVLAAMMLQSRVPAAATRRIRDISPSAVLVDLQLIAMPQEAYLCMRLRISGTPSPRQMLILDATGAQVAVVDIQDHSVRPMARACYLALAEMHSR